MRDFCGILDLIEFIGYLTNSANATIVAGAAAGLAMATIGAVAGMAQNGR